ncbi:MULTISPECIES: acyl carrier protein [Halocynthiibacter]|uniref:Acyl carrier protein n=1 Tax=Halocynthiibacter halioticoli TaxID=2986804 RepID=A0AAE3J0I1_9RHOB|nr:MULTISPECIES: acyl carrier protein [Halocynthiibacter]MCV6825414.1 acyl carrier protein [Halocynthiibacter halioticoli]MCW4058415.1 acyl carrier protein [Halocynthiibacter sp. SDUM655004]
MADSQVILDKVTEIIRELFDEYDGPVTMTTTADDIPQWDSLAHVRLMMMIEMELGVQFSTSGMLGFENLGEMVEEAAKQST